MKRFSPFVGVLLLLSSVAFSQVPGNANSNSKHYRDSGLGNAQGRQGSAVLTTRSLLNKDGSTNVELTTGVLDTTATQPGAFGKVQFKPLDMNGDAITAQNFTPLSTAGGYYTFTTNVLHHNQQVQLQANITGIDKRTDVATVIDSVRLRPDLTVSQLGFPSSALINTPVNIAATIRELNGDTGANANVVLAIDGTNVDSANGIWVDAGGTVSVAFTYTFTSTGSHTIQVTAGNVVPADYDTSNNSASGTINITANNLSISGSFQDSSYAYQAGYEYKLVYDATGSVLYDYVSQGNETWDSQIVWANFSSVNNGMLHFPATFKVVESMDGVTKFQNAGNLSGYDGGNWSYGWGFVDNGYSYVYSYSYNGSSEVYGAYYRYAGDVTYWSNVYACDWWNWNPSGSCSATNNNYYYSWNSSYQSSQGNRIVPGSVYTLGLGFQGSDGAVFAGTGVSNLSSSTSTWGYGVPNSCSSNPYVYNDGSFTYTNCDEYNVTQTYTSGTISPQQ